MRQPESLTYRDLAKYVDGEVTASQAEEMDAVLSSARESRRRLDRVKRVVAHLGDTSGVDDIDLMPGLRARLAGMEVAARPRQRRWRWPPRYLGLAAAAVVALALSVVFLRDGSKTSRGEADGFRAKSAAGHTDPRSRWIALNVFRLSGNAEPEPLGETLRVEDGLLFSYSNLGPEPFSRLMIFAVDATGRIYWYYPAFLDERDDPKGIAIEKGASRAPLHEVIAHPYREGALAIFGLFSDDPLTVSEVEAAVRRGAKDRAGFEAAFDGVRVKSLNAEVSR